MKNEKIAKINQIGKIGKIVATVLLVLSIIGSVLAAGVSIACFSLPGDIAKVNLSGTAQIEIAQDYLDFGKKIFSEVKEGMTEEGQELEIAGSKYEYVSATIDENDNINIEYKSLKDEITVKDFAVFMIGVAIDTLMVAYILVFVLALCKAIEKSESPFDENVIDKMKKLAFSFIPWVLLKGVGTGLQARALTGVFEYETALDVSTVIVVLILVVLIFVFKYGAELQKQSDETL